MTTDEVLIARDLLNAGSAYASWEIPKGNGGVRKITAPVKEVKNVQTAILRRILYFIPVHFIAHGFLKNLDIFTNARAHTGARFILNLDLKDAFPSTRDHRVRVNLQGSLKSFLRKQFGKGISDEEIEDILHMIVKVCCHEGCLPQGAPTSPALLNLVCMHLDQQLAALADQHDLTVTRYADDITFSSKVAPIPLSLKPRIFATISNAGWKVNPLKTKHFSRSLGHTLEITGLFLQEDGRLTVPTERREIYRTFLNDILQKESLEDSDRHRAIGIIVYMTRVYNGRLPSSFGKIWGKVKVKHGFKDAPASKRQMLDMYGPEV